MFCDTWMFDTDNKGNIIHSASKYGFNEWLIKGIVPSAKCQYIMIISQNMHLNLSKFCTSTITFKENSRICNATFNCNLHFLITSLDRICFL